MTRELNCIRMLFERADATGWGETRLAQWWNGHATIPVEFKGVSPYTIGYWLSNPIYKGVLRHNEVTTGLVCDTRVIRANDQADVLIVQEFCRAAVEPEVFDRVQAHHRARQDVYNRNRTSDPDGKLVAPQSRGLTLVYLLSGLVRCGCCGGSMRATTSGRGIKGGKRYTYYACARSVGRACLNRRYVPEVELRAAVVGRLRARLFPTGDAAGVPGWMPDLVSTVEKELARLRAMEPDQTAAAERESREIDRQLCGWAVSLSDPTLPATVRADLAGRYDAAKRRQVELQAGLAADRALADHVRTKLSAAAVVEELRRLDKVLAGYNPTVANLLLSRHIERIECHPDGRVELRGTQIGVFDGLVELLSRPGSSGGESLTDSVGPAPVTPRRRTRLNIPTLSAEATDAVGDASATLDPDRFAGLPPDLMWAESFVLDHRPCWAEAHAAAVAAARREGATHEQLAARFSKTVPTIRSALKFAAALDPAAGTLPRRQPRTRWDEQHYREVAELRGQGRSLKELCAHFGKSEPLIRAALLRAAAAGGETPERKPDESDGRK